LHLSFVGGFERFVEHRGVDGIEGHIMPLESGHAGGSEILRDRVLALEVALQGAGCLVQTDIHRPPTQHIMCHHLNFFKNSLNSKKHGKIGCFTG
jgi:hypothetical protein